MMLDHRICRQCRPVLQSELASKVRELNESLVSFSIYFADSAAAQEEDLLVMIRRRGSTTPPT
jgi:hypothetical protein